MSSVSIFQPDWVSSTGEAIRQRLAQQRVSLSQFAAKMELAPQAATALLAGQIVVDDGLAVRLSTLVGGTPEFWLRREQQHRASGSIWQFVPDTAEEWLTELPVSEMAKLGWIAPPSNKGEAAVSCMAFFGVSDPAEWAERYSRDVSAAAFRTSQTFKSSPFAVAAWLRWASIQANSIACEKWDRAKFRLALPELRRLTRKKTPSEFLPALRKLCADCGVAVVIGRAPTHCRASGATRFLSKDKALIALTFRHKTDDHFWFTFFHEAAHLILHSESALFIEDDNEIHQAEEDEANAFSAEILVPNENWVEIKRTRLVTKDLLRIARKIGVSPGILIGQMQHRGYVERHKLNWLKRRYAWSGAEIVNL